MNQDQLREIVQSWVQQTWLRPLDRAFMLFLLELDPQAQPLLLLAATLASHQLGRGHACLDLAATLANPDETLALPPEGEPGVIMPVLPSKLLHQLTLAHWQHCIAVSNLVADGVGNTPLVLVGHRLYLRRYWQYEQTVAQAILCRLQAPAVSPTDLTERLAVLFPANQNQRPDWQKIACALAARGAFTVITGGPGTGKTTTVVRLLALLLGVAKQEGRSLRIRLAAPTGKAAARLTESIGKAIKNLPADIQAEIPTEASTLHRLLGSRIGTRHFRHNASNPLHADWVVVDEASMIDLEMMAALLSALPQQARLVLLGDKDQLASVEAGAVMGELCVGAGVYPAETVLWLQENADEDASAFQGQAGQLTPQIALLRVSHRFRSDSGIGQLALAVNSGDGAAVQGVLNRQPPYPDLARLPLNLKPEAWMEIALEGGRGYFPLAQEPPQGYAHYLRLIKQGRPALNAPAEAYADWAKAVLEGFDQFRVLCALRQGAFGVAGLNQQIAEGLLQARLIEKAKGWYEGRPVMVTRNDYGLGLMNGDIGIALNMPEEGGVGVNLRAVFRLSDGSLKVVATSRMTEVETVYAMTVHKSQGSEFSHVALVLPDRPNPILTRELIYTGITRARHWFTLLAPDLSLLPSAISRQVQRSGGLGELLNP